MAVGNRFRKIALALCALLFLFSAIIFSYQLYAFVTKGTAQPVQAASRSPPPDEFFRGVSRDSPVFLLFSLFSMIASAVAAVAIHYGGAGGQKPASVGGVAQHHLMPGERKLVQLLQENKGTLTQSELVKRSGMSKLRVSRMVKRLEKMKVLHKQPYGMTNSIRLEAD